MNPKDEVKFEDIKKLVNASLEKFYKNDRDLIEMSNEEDMISEQCMVFHIGSYMKNKMNTLTKFQWADLDCEYNRNMNDPKMMRSDRKIIPDLVIHRRRSNRNNLLVIEFKKKNAETYDKVQIPLHRITDSASNGSVFPVVTEHFSASSDHAFL